ncbi:MAG: peptidase S10 [Candidatus Aegiribacteria sp.]|nr:peptidase S10 [Candidatus Aegiribacteria sp.]
MSSEKEINPEKAEEKETDKEKEEKLRMLGLEPSETAHGINLKDGKLAYKARVGVLPLKDDKGEIQAEIYFTSYEMNGVKDLSERPLTFAFNGGPGSSSVWLHMGALGPKRVVMKQEGWMPSPPYHLEDNESTWLKHTDLVFIDPVGTGFSRAAKKDLYQKFHSFDGDIESVGKFIQLYLSRFNRWSSPLFLAGESYGTTRAAGLAAALFGKGIAFNGIILISTALDLRPIMFRDDDDLPFQLFIPTYTAAAWYHKKLDKELQSRDLPDLLAEVEVWVESELTPALMKGDRISDEESADIADKLSRYSGLEKDYIVGSNLRIHQGRFRKELLRSEKRSVGRLDSRFKGIEAVEVNDRPEFDPSMTSIKPPYTSMLNDYLRRELGLDTDMSYEVMMDHDFIKNWKWEKGKLPSTGEKLRLSMSVNPYMKVLVAQGYYDLATPLMATKYMVSHMNVDLKLKKNIQETYYHAGHMFYLDEKCLDSFSKDVHSFIEESCENPEVY